MFFIFSISGIFAFDLWNGLETTLPKREVIECAKTILQATEYWEYSESIFSRTKEELKEDLEIFAFDKWQLNGQFPKRCTVVFFKTELPGFSHNISRDPSVVLYFYNDILFAIKIIWGVNFDDMFIATKEQFGNQDEIIEMNGENNHYDKNRIYIWKEDQKIIYLQNWYHMGLPMYIINRQALNDYSNEQIQLEQKRREELENERQRAIDGIRF
jgi:hypothetical protein